MPEEMSVSRIIQRARIMLDEQAEPRLRFDAAKELAQHLYPKCEDAVEVQDFSECEQAAIRIESLERKAMSRAFDGWDEPVYRKGKLVGHRRRHSDTLQRFLRKAKGDPPKRVSE